MSKVLLTTIISLAFASTTYASPSTTQTVAATNNPPTVTDSPTTQRDTTTSPDRTDRATSRAYPALDSNCRYVDGRKVCDGKRMDNESNSAIRRDADDLDDDEDSRSLNR